MRRKRITIGMLSMMMAVTSVFGGVNVSAATPKLTANQVYDSTTMIKGKVKKGTTVKVKIGKKTYRSKIKKKRYSVKIPKTKAGVKYTIKAYNGKKLYAKKASKVKHLYKKPVYKTVQYQEKGHWEWVDTGKFSYNMKFDCDVCDTCGKNLTKEYLTAIAAGTHTMNEMSYNDYLKNGGWDHSCINHKIVKKTIEKSEQKDNEKIKMWVVDQQASTKKELVGYECSCGAIKGK